MAGSSSAWRAGCRAGNMGEPDERHDGWRFGADRDETEVLVAYLRKHASARSTRSYPDVDKPEGQFKLACRQCHAARPAAPHGEGMAGGGGAHGKHAG
jgi:hypothetical protein